MDKLKIAGAGIIGAIGLNKFTNIAAQSEEDKRWLVYNYPPLLKLIHYSLDGLQ